MGIICSGTIKREGDEDGLQGGFSSMESKNIYHKCSEFVDHPVMVLKCKVCQRKGGEGVDGAIDVMIEIHFPFFSPPPLSTSVKVHFTPPFWFVGSGRKV